MKETMPTALGKLKAQGGAAELIGGWEKPEGFGSMVRRGPLDLKRMKVRRTLWGGEG